MKARDKIIDVICNCARKMDNNDLAILLSYALSVTDRAEAEQQLGADARGQE